MFDEISLRAISDEFSVEAKKNENLGRRCSYKTGGEADVLFLPDTTEKLKGLIEKLRKENIPYFILGRGSNLLVSDDGFRGAVLSTERLDKISVKGKIITCEAGVYLPKLIETALYSSLGGLEFLSGIPASVGGALTMNAGCFGKSIGDYVSFVISDKGIFARDNCEFSYRQSRFLKNKEAVLTACFNLENIECDLSEAKIEYFKNLRKGKQPKGKSSGCVFKNDGYTAGKVIEEVGLKGYKIGGARVSEKHGNFILADDDAKSSDIKKLIDFIKEKVYKEKGITLTEEIEYLGVFNENND